MIAYNKLYDKLTDAFIRYQWRLEHPMPSPTETSEKMVMHYLNDPVFNSKVSSLVAGVIHIVQQVEDMGFDSRIDHIGQNGNDGDHYEEQLELDL